LSFWLLLKELRATKAEKIDVTPITKKGTREGAIADVVAASVAATDAAFKHTIEADTVVKIPDWTACVNSCFLASTRILLCLGSLDARVIMLQRLLQMVYVQTP
jgi:hypothetical protein